jgi:hypothetical protein
VLVCSDMTRLGPQIPDPNRAIVPATCKPASILGHGDRADRIRMAYEGMQTGPGQRFPDLDRAVTSG